jgi:hypothetical protein
VKDSFYEELKRVFDNFPKWHMKILIENFSVKGNKENVFKPTVWNETLHEISNHNRFKSSTLWISENLILKITMFPHRNIIRLAVFWYVCGGIQAYLLFDDAEQQYDTVNHPVAAKLRKD